MTYESSYLRHRPLLVRLATAKVGAGDAEDVVQEAAFRVFRSWDGIGSLTFYRKALYHAVVDRLRSQTRHPALPLYDSTPSALVTENRALARLELRAVLDALMQSRAGRRLLRVVLLHGPRSDGDYEVVSRTRRLLRQERAA